MKALKNLLMALALMVTVSFAYASGVRQECVGDLLRLNPGQPQEIFDATGVEALDQEDTHYQDALVPIDDFTCESSANTCYFYKDSNGVIRQCDQGDYTPTNP